MNSLKEKFDNYAPQPDEKVWEEINSSLLHRRMRRRWTTASAAVAVGVGAVALLFALKNDNPSSSVAVDEVVVSENITSVSLEKNEAVMEQETVSELFHRQDAAPAVISSDLSSPKAENNATETQSATADARADEQHETTLPTQPAVTVTEPTPVVAEQTAADDAAPAKTKSKAKAEEKAVETADAQEPQHRILPKIQPQELVVWIPNAFSPDDPAEESARIFKVIPNNDASIRTFEIFIYSRTGRLVYHSKDFTQGWDGTANGQKQPMGTYVYIIELNDAVKGLQHTKGSITLLR